MGRGWWERLDWTGHPRTGGDLQLPSSGAWTLTKKPRCFTSGSTGPAKGVRYSHRILIAQTRLIRDLYDIQPGEVDMPGLPVFALGHGGHRARASHRAHPTRGFDPQRWWD